MGNCCSLCEVDRYFLAAAAADDISRAVSLLSQGADIEATYDDGSTALHVACSMGYHALVHALLEAGADREAKDEALRTPLHAACAEGHALCVEALLQHRVNIEAKTFRGFTPLFIACAYGHEECVNALLNAGANWTTMTRAFTFPDHVACECGHGVCNRVILRSHANVEDALECLAGVPLFFSQADGCEVCVRFCLEVESMSDAAYEVDDAAPPRGASCTAPPDEYSRVVLDAGAETDEALEVLCEAPLYVRRADGSLLCVSMMRTTTAEFSTAAKEDTLNHHHASTFEDIEFADMVTLKSERVKKALRVLGVTPFHKPELDGSEEHVRSLLNGRARVTAALGVLATAPMSSAELSRDSPCAILLKKERSNFRLARLTSEATPLFVACAKGHSACARALLVADTSAVDMRLNRWTPFHIACLFGHNACLEALLLKRHAILDAHDEDGWTPFHIACANGRIACVQALLEAGANKDAMTNDGWRPLHVACIFGHDACVRALLDAEANKEAADNNGWTPLHTACANGHAACARTLLNSLVTKDVVDAFGRTPLFLATVMSCEAIVRILLQMGASVYVGTRSGCNPLSIARNGGNAIIESLLAEAEAEQTPPVPNAIAVVPTRTALSSTISPIELPLTPPAGTSLTPVVVPQLLYSELIFDSEAGGAQIELGRGSFGNVYAGRWKGERVAIKKMSLPLELVASGRFRREVELHMRANYKHVVRVYGAAVRPVRDITDKMTCYVVMDRMPTDLSCALFGSFATDHPAYNIAATARLLPQRMRLLLEIARGVRFLHAQNIVHADLKPSNVMLCADGHAQLTDFGLAVQRKIDASRTRSSQIGMRGSLPYMDPALFYENMSVKPASDMYSWGVLAWEVLTLRKPYENTIRNLGSAVLAAGAGLTASTDAASPLSGPTMPSMNRRTFSGDRPHDVLARVADVPPGLRALIVRCWSENQSARPTAEDAIAVLEPLVEG